MSTWIRIKPYGEDAYIYWISGIYKIVSYPANEYHAYFIPDHYENWGDHVATPPDQGENGKVWRTLKSAQSACVAHAKTHTHSLKTVKRSSEIKTALIEQAKQYAEAA